MSSAASGARRLSAPGPAPLDGDGALERRDQCRRAAVRRETVRLRVGKLKQQDIGLLQNFFL